MTPLPRLRFALALATAALSTGFAAHAQDAPVYRRPPQVVADILTAPRVPRGSANVSPDGARLVLPEIPPLVGIEVLAEPVEKLAGLEVLPAWRATRGQLKSALTGFSIARVVDGKKARARLPEGARVGPIAWSARGDRLACGLYARGGAEVWIVSAETGEAHRLDGVRLNTAVTSAIEWANDDAALWCATVATAEKAMPAERRVPDGPQVRWGAGKPAPQRTARDVLKTDDDRARFDRAVTAQLVRVPVAGGAPEPIGPATMLASWSLASDERHVIVQSVSGLPFGFPWSLFPRTVVILGSDGSRAGALPPIPLDDRSAISSVARLGPRSWRWAPDGGSVWFFSFEDREGVDPFAAVRDTALPQPGSDRLLRLDAPFTGAPAVVATSDFQYQDMAFTGDGRRLLLWQGYEPRRRQRIGWIEVAGERPAMHALIDRSVEGVYDDPGRPLARAAGHGSALWTSRNGRMLYWSGEGFRADGQRPFLDALDLDSGKRTRLFESTGDVLETAVALLDPDADRFVTLRQSNTAVPNFFARRRGQKSGRQLSEYADPAPALTASKRAQFKFTRSDGVQLNAEVVLPGDWKGGALPTIFWVYPNDYRSAAAAGQNRRSPNRFPSQSPLNPEVLVTQGYAVVYPDLAVVGTNDRYVEEIQASARAALEECVRRGFTDSTRVGVGGHSYGAFSTANLLAHTDLFKAGIASDGAYNRTLTPFTFQAEERTLWQAPQTYLGMSPFMSADRIHEPLLLLHNLDDTNVGTNPMQSERMFEALNGMGKTVSLIEYPYEDHGPASRETVLDYWSRVIDWFDAYVKRSDGKSAAHPAP